VGFVVNKKYWGRFSPSTSISLPRIPLVAPHASSTSSSSFVAGTTGHLVASVIVDSVTLHPKKHTRLIQWQFPINKIQDKNKMS
jgi:hypothetical protein